MTIIEIFMAFVGFYPPTSGTALVNGYDITEDIANVRGSLGICPQHDVLFDTLTVDEHLRFFAEVRFSTFVQMSFYYFLRKGVRKIQNAIMKRKKPYSCQCF